MMNQLLSQRILLYIAVLVTVGSWKQVYGQFIFSGSGSGNIGLPILKFGSNQKFLPINAPDSTSEAIPIPLGFPFGATIESLAYVGDNGVISFRDPFFLWEPQPFPSTTNGVRFANVIAPYWSDNDIRREGIVSYEVFEFQRTGTYGDEVLTIVNNYIMEEYGNSTNFVGVYMILAEWTAVHPFPHGTTASLSSTIESFVAKTNTYQAVLITDLDVSYAIFTYECGRLQWSGLDAFPTIGFNSPSDGTFANHPLTAQEGATEIACSPSSHTNNVIYQISKGQSAVEERKRMCLAWYISDFDNYDATLIDMYDQFTLSCPCTFFQAFFDRRFRFVFNPNKTSFCFTTRFLTFGVALRECCYSFDGLTFGALVIDTENGGSLLLSPIPDESLQQNNSIPQSLCCSAAVGLCDLYYERRLPNFCEDYVPLRFIWGWGDPHITTLDEFTYTFNGIGEYVLVSSVDDDIEFQGRTVEVENSGATAFSAFAIRHNGTTVQISWNTGFTVLVNGNDESDGVITVNSTIENSMYVLERIANNSLLLSFPSGLTLTTNYTSSGIFNFVLNIPPSLNGSTKGLLGTLNGNVSDDLIFRSGTLLPITSSDAEKHSFGQSWQISQSESIFQYMAGQNVTTLSQPGHMPPFLDEIRDNLEGNSSLTAVCGNNTECLFDFSQTGDEAVGMATMAFMEEVTDSVIMSESFPPNISAPEIFLATVGVASIYSFIVTRSVNVTVVINGQNTLPPNTSFADNGDTFTLTWNPADISEEFNLTIIATAEQSARSTFVPRVQLCGCLYGGNCTEDGVLNLETPFVVLNCECPAAYDGNFCENDADGCDAISCLAGQSCTDNIAPEAGAVCSCPDGYNEINSKCVDINECDNATANNCTELQVCINAPGSFSCSCRPGYRSSSTSSMLCEDINECEEYNDCHQICINTDGSFDCSCIDSFELLPDNRTCQVAGDAMCPESNNCDQICYINATTMGQICTCERGYQIHSDGITCNDVNECNMTESPCSQNCSNTNGSFTCSCENGYTLDSDDRTCNDVNECLQISTTPCMEGRLCSNTIGAFECLCPPGTILMGEDCLLITITTSALPTVTPTATSVMPTGTGGQDDDDDGLTGGEIAGIVIGSTFAGIILLAIIIFIVIWATRYRAKSITITPRLIMYKNGRDDVPDRVEATPNVYSVVMTQTGEHVIENENREDETKEDETKEDETKEEEESTTKL